MKHRLLSVLEAILFGATALLLGTDARCQTSGNVTNAQVAALLQRIQSERYGPSYHPLLWNTNGDLIEAHLSYFNSFDSNLFVISQIKSLQTLYIAYRHGLGMTRDGLASLAQLTNLTELHFACFFEMQPGMFGEITKLDTIRDLHLYYSFPPKSEYGNLSRMTNLEKFELIGCTNFGSEELKTITNLTNLKSFELNVFGEAKLDTNALACLKNLTNVVVRCMPKN